MGNRNSAEVRILLLRHPPTEQQHGGADNKNQNKRHERVSGAHGSGPPYGANRYSIVRRQLGRKTRAVGSEI
jgi:hypothetical protein